MTCLKCGKVMLRAGGHFCATCKAGFRAESERKRNRKKHAERGAMAAELLPHLCEHHGQELVSGVKRLRKLQWDYIQGLPDRLVGEVPDLHEWDYLRDADTASGPNEGSSTGHVSLQVELMCRNYEAMGHPWWDENPHWNFELHDDVTARLYLDLPVCGDQKGTAAGYQRHRRAGEMACPECSAAERERKSK